MAHEKKTERTELYRWAIGLSVAYAIDGGLYAWTLLMGGYSGLAYGTLSFLPVFVPAFLLGLVATRLYWQGLTQHGWTLRKAEWLFLFLFASAVGAKVIVSIYNSVR